eukprot:CAMPEP_0202969126 /NCGR_PEP_ID=MMETSP1396-20130829/14769_1 /ASSEMBLY_ACC=CAM_ASM_000872 /TAXON_ID= /ORGANISM="Pseudokeronopsis sp., Strain Brazil" /LENGTH=83 /DNA_ID=CAMNT_0049696321 /DNA_START=169 /DNA_END=420 /DNA_ORIENTATION=+
MIFAGKKQIDLEIPDEDITIELLIQILKKEHLKDKEEMFVSGSTVRPGIIVLINDTDWELLDQHKYKLMNNDNVAFISTLHGG